MESRVETIGVRELRRDASRWLARARAGESFVITDRGDPIARLVPFGERQGYAAMVADGRLVPGTGRPLDDILADVDAVAGVPPGSELADALAELRDDER